MDFHYLLKFLGHFFMENMIYDIGMPNCAKPLKYFPSKYEAHLKLAMMGWI